jgi:hypothetical protein
MSYTSQLKPQVDLPVWEWMRFAPPSSVTLSSTTRDERYMYYLNASLFYRYDTHNDGWQQLASPLLGTTTLVDMFFASDNGYYGNAIGAGTGNNTIEMAGLSGNSLVGYKIKITSGTGAGQERTITAVSAPIVKETGLVTTTSTAAIIDAVTINTSSNYKFWKVNQYRDHQVRVTFGGGATQVRKILANAAQTLTISSPDYTAITPMWGASLNPTVTGAGSFYQVESHVVTVNSDWDINPDSTSEFLVQSGGIWAISSTTSPNYTIQYYDILADVWYTKSAQTGHLFNALGTDVSMTGATADGGAILSATSTSATARSIVNSAASMPVNSYANFKLEITSGAGKGQVRTILANTATTIYVVKDFSITPDNTSTFQIKPDVEKIFISGNGSSVTYQYHSDSDQLVQGRIYDHGVARSGSIALGSKEPLAIASITKTTATAIRTLNPTPAVAGSGYLVGQILTLATGTGGQARITSVNSTGAVLSVSLENCGTTGYTGATTYATTVNVTGGTGCTLTVTTVGEVAVLTTSIAHNITYGDAVTIAGASAANYNGAKTILTAPTTTTLQFVAPADAAPTFTAHSTTLIVDAAKNWITNEHIGKLIQITLTTGGQQTAAIRRITANTANTITFVSGTAPVQTSASKYVIFGNRSFGTAMSQGAITGGGSDGIATSGTTTSLTDSTKNWPINYWSNTLPTGASNSGRRLRIIAGTGAGQELTITSNTATTLNFASATAPDATSVYEILDSYGMATGGGTTTLIDTTQNWGTNVLAGKRVKMITGAGQGQESIITSNTQTTLTFTAGTAVDNTVAYSILEIPGRGAGVRIDIVNGSTDASIKNRFMYAWRGGATSELSRYNINTERFDFFTYFPLTETLTTGSMYAYDGKDRIYFTKESTNRVMYYDVVKNQVFIAGMIPFGMGTAIIGNRMEIFTTADGLKYLYIMRHSGQEMWRTLLFN